MPCIPTIFFSHLSSQLQYELPVSWYFPQMTAHSNPFISPSSLQPDVMLLRVPLAPPNALIIFLTFLVPHLWPPIDLVYYNDSTLVRQQLPLFSGYFQVECFSTWLCEQYFPVVKQFFSPLIQGLFWARMTKLTSEGLVFFSMSH